MNKLISAAVILCITASVLCAVPFRTFAEEDDSYSVDLTGNGDGYSNILYDNSNGLPTSEANAIAETGDGFIWIGSYSGLIRYDGNTFERVDSSNGIASVVSLFVDSKDRLWVGTNDSGVAVKINDDFKVFNKNDGLLSLSTRSVSEDSEGNIYVATTRGVAIIDNDMNLTQVDDERIKDEYIRGITLGGDGIIYGVTMNGCVFTMKDGKVTGFYDSLALGISNVHSICSDPDNPGYIYIGTKTSELWHVKLSDTEKAVRTNVYPLEYLNAISVGEGAVWICADNGIGMVRDGKVIQVNDTPMKNAIEDVMRDYQGNLWFVSSKQGVMKIVPNQFDDIFEKYGIEESVVNTTCIYDNKLFIGTKHDGLIVVGSKGVVDNVPITSGKTPRGAIISENNLIDLLEGTRIRSIIRDSKDRLWISTYGDTALLRYDHGKVMQFTTHDGLPSSRIRTVFEKDDGTVMVACTGGLAIIDGDEVTKLYDSSSGISNTEILTVTEADNGDMILGTDGDGMYIISGDNVKHLSVDDGLSSDVIMRVKRDISRNIYWIVTSNSLSYMDADYNITTINKFPYSNNFDLYENSKGDMWVLSSNGIYVVPSADLIANDTMDPVFYGINSGLTTIATANSYSAITEDGDLYLSGTTGVARVNIEKPFESVDNLKATVPYVEVDGERIYPDKDGTFNIPFGARKLTIYCYVFTYSLMNPQVTYKLDGFDTAGTTVRRSELGPIDYTNLGGGSYTFNLKISDAMNRGNHEFSFKIVKEKSFYEQLWFYILLFVILIFVLQYVIRSKVLEQIEQHEEEKRRLEEEAKKNKQLISGIVEAFAKTIDMKDKYTNGHSKRVAQYTAMLAREMGEDEETVEKYYNIALLHDIGKIGVPEDVLNKNGKLTDQEFNLIKSHSALGRNVLKDISIMPELAIGAGCHHERPDGRGYPLGMKGDDIPPVARVIAVADTFDAMYSDRPYRNRMNFDKVVSIIKEVSGTQLDEKVVEAFLRLVEKGEFRDPNDKGGGSTEDIDNIHKRFNDEEKAAKEKAEKEKAEKENAGKEPSGNEKSDKENASSPEDDSDSDNGSSD